MASNWMDERERMNREHHGRGMSNGPRANREEDRSWDRERVFGERESGASYGRAGSPPRAWQDPDYEGVSPAMRQGGGYERGRYARGADEATQDYRGGGRFYGDDAQSRIYREEYDQGGPEYGDVPTGYDFGGYSPTRRYRDQSYGQASYGGYPQEFRSDEFRRNEFRSGEFRREMNRPASGGTGGYDYERGYGDGGRGEGRSDRFEEAGRSAGEYLRRAGEKMAAWFTGGGEARLYDPHYLDPTRGPARGARGLGPQGYKRSDERINDDIHERLTDDAWLDASNISISVSGGEVTLSGAVDSREAKHHAERLIEDLSGVAHVQNNLRIAKGSFFTSPTSGYGDSVLGAQIRAADAQTAAPNATDGPESRQSSASRKN